MQSSCYQPITTLFISITNFNIKSFTSIKYIATQPNSEALQTTKGGIAWQPLFIAGLHKLRWLHKCLCNLRAESTWQRRVQWRYSKLKQYKRLEWKEQLWFFLFRVISYAFYVFCVEVSDVLRSPFTIIYRSFKCLLRGKFILSHFFPHFPPNFQDIAY